MSTAATIAFFLPSLAGGGAERNIIRLAGAFLRRGYRVSLIVCNGTGPNRSWIPPGVELVDLGVVRAMRAILPLARRLRQAPPAVLVAALDEANLVALMAKALSRSGVPIVISSRSAITPTQKYMKGFRARLIIPWLVRRCYPYADGIVAVSKGAAEDLARRLGLPQDRVVPIPNPVAEERVDRMQHDELLHPWIAAIGDAPLVVAVGRLTFQKDHELLVRALARVRTHLPRVRLAILGEGEDRPRLEALGRELNLGDAFILPGYQENPYSWMRRAGVVALSSRFEGLPTVIIEGLACGARIVSTDCPAGPSEILVDGKWGTLVPVGDEVALADGIVTELGRGRWPVPPAEALQPFTEQPVTEAFERVLLPLMARGRTAALAGSG